MVVSFVVVSFVVVVAGLGVPGGAGMGERKRAPVEPDARFRLQHAPDRIMIDGEAAMAELGILAALPCRRPGCRRSQASTPVTEGVGR